MTKQELLFGDKKEVCKVVLHRLIQVSPPHPLESRALPEQLVSQMHFLIFASVSGPQLSRMPKKNGSVPQHLRAQEIRAGTLVGRHLLAAGVSFRDPHPNPGLPQYPPVLLSFPTI